MKSKLFFGKL